MSARPPEDSARQSYWRSNLRLVATLLAVWFAVSFGAGILFVDVLDRVRVPGTGLKLGFWMAQQGSIVVFVVLIFVYARRMDRLERECGVDEQKPGARGTVEQSSGGKSTGGKERP